MAVLGQIEAKPLLAPTWPEAKALVFELLKKCPHGRNYGVHAQQVADFHRSEQSVRIVSAPARTSKSISTAADTLAYVLPTDPPTDSLHWLIGPTYPTNKEFFYLHDWLCVDKVLQDPTIEIETARKNASNGDMLIVLRHSVPGAPATRAVIQGMSSTNEKALQGEEVTTATLSEAAEHPVHVYDKYLSTRCWKTNLPTTPKPHAEWIRQMIEHGEQDAGLGIDSFTFPADANPLYNWERYHQAERKARLRSVTGQAADDPWFAEQFLGQWVYYTGRALPFDPIRHVLPRDFEGMESCLKFVSVDYGYRDDSVALFWAVHPSGLLVVFDEIYEAQLDTHAFVEKVDARLDSWGFAIDYAVGDPSRPEVEKLIREAGLPVYNHGSKNALRDRAAGHRRLVDLLTEGPIRAVPGLLVHERCTNTITEWKHLRYREGATNEYGTNALEGKDHAFDAARYGVMSRPQPRVEAGGGDWLRQHQRRTRQARARSVGHTLHATIGGPAGWR